VVEFIAFPRIISL